MAHPAQREKFWQLSHCTLRAVNITQPFWTYCQNFGHGEQHSETHEVEEPKGWIFANGLYEGYLRIPWHGTAEPLVSVPCECLLCGRTTANGIAVRHQDEDVGFCTNRHYIDWWKTVHDDPNISSDGLATPEEFYKEK